MSENKKRTTEYTGARDAATPEEAVRSVGKVESRTPGRMRVRVKPDLRTPANMARIEQQLRNHPDVSQVTVNKRTGSVVFTHDKESDGHGVLASVLSETELLVDFAFDLPEDEEEGGEGGGDAYGKLDQQLSDLAYKVEYAVWKRTHLRFRGQILAGTIAGVGIAQLAITGITLETLPGPILLWVAWDIYHRVAKEPPFPEEVATDAGASGAPVTATEPAVP